jgi:hypothetical protein
MLQDTMENKLKLVFKVYARPLPPAISRRKTSAVRMHAYVRTLPRGQADPDRAHIHR